MKRIIIYKKNWIVQPVSLDGPLMDAVSSPYKYSGIHQRRIQETCQGKTLVEYNMTDSGYELYLI